MFAIATRIVYQNFPTRREIILLWPLILWLLVFQFGQFIPVEYRPSIDVSTLPQADRILFGTELVYTIQPRNDVLVLVAATPYLFHFILPWLYALYLFMVDAKPFAFLWCIGILNSLAVATQFLFPTAAPWYTAKYGMEPASYDMKGDPGRLGRADSILNFDLFKGIYGSSPIVFGSFPSLHAAWPFLIALFSSYYSLPAKSFKWVYMLWVWWAAVYTKHHFIVDVLGGGLYAAFTFYLAKKILGKAALPGPRKPSSFYESAAAKEKEHNFECAV